MQREDMVNQRQAELDRVKCDSLGQCPGDPQAAALHLTSNTLRTVKATVMVVMCLAAGLIIALGSGLLFPNTRVRSVLPID
jgi:hypothetical protein